MAAFDLNNYINELPANIRNKFKDCKTAEEILETADANDLELPEDALDMISGGWFCPSSGSTNKIVCECKSENVVSYGERSASELGYHHKCLDCLRTW